MNLVKKSIIGFWSLIRSMAVTVKYFFKKPITIQYPKEEDQIPEVSRGILKMAYDIKDQAKCTACGICVQICPVKALEIKSSFQKEGQPLKLQEYIFDQMKCMYCGLCTENCPFKAIYWSSDFEYASDQAESKITYPKERMPDPSIFKIIKVQPEDENKPISKNF